MKLECKNTTWFCLNLTPLTRCLNFKLAKPHTVPFRVKNDLLCLHICIMQYETNKLASTWMLGKRKQNYYSMHYIQKYKKNLEIEIFGPLVNDTHIIHIFVNDYILPSLSTPWNSRNKWKRCLFVYPILLLFYTHTGFRTNLPPL